MREPYCLILQADINPHCLIRLSPLGFTMQTKSRRGGFAATHKPLPPLSDAIWPLFGHGRNLAEIRREGLGDELFASVVIVGGVALEPVERLARTRNRLAGRCRKIPDLRTCPFSRAALVRLKAPFYPCFYLSLTQTAIFAFTGSSPSDTAVTVSKPFAPGLARTSACTQPLNTRCSLAWKSLMSAS